MKWLALLLVLVACQPVADIPSEPAPPPNTTAVATFAGGCFWCMEPPFEKLAGVSSAVSGYAGGTVENPTYKQVTAGNTGHKEVVQITYDPGVVSYEELLDVYWRQIDPTDAGGSFVDRGFSYTSAIFYQTEEERIAAEASKESIAALFSEPIATEIVPFTNFYPAEEYHQDYYKKNSLKYNYYRSRSGRDDFIEEFWESEET